MENNLPLKGRRIVVTRARRLAGSLAAALIGVGAEVIEIPTIEIVPLDSFETLDTALQNLSGYQWLIVTSANTVRVLIERLAALGIPASASFHSGPEPGDRPKIAAVGSATARALREQGIMVDVIPEQYFAESLVAAVGEQVSGSRILLARASVARDVIPDELRRGGAVVDVIDAYRTEVPSDAIPLLRQAFSDGASLPDAVTFTSSSTVKNFLALWEAARPGSRPEALRAISIGPITSAALREHGWEPAAEASPHDVNGLFEAVKSLFSR